MSTLLAREEVRRPSAGTRSRPASAWHWRFLAPLFIVLGLTTVVPLIFTVLTSFGVIGGDLTQGDLDYSQLVQSAEFWNAMRVQAIFVVASVGIEIVLGTGIALLLNQPGRVSTFLRGIILAPTLLPTIVVAMVASFMLQSNVGLISVLLETFGVEQAWLARGGTALAVLVGVDVWQFTPFVAILVLAGLQGIPHETLEAGRVDGASRLQLIAHVVMPQLYPAVIAAGLLRFIDAIQVFPTIYILTNGGPGTATSALNFYGFVQFFQLGHERAGAAAAVILAIITVLIATLVTLSLRPKENR